MDQPNVLLVMTDQERYPPPYESPEAGAFRRDRMPGRQRIRESGVELHRHYTASTACVPSRASLFTGQYPTLHGVRQTDGLAKHAFDPAMMWLDPDTVPTMGDWFRAAGYRTEYRGKWHISHADLPIAGSRARLATNDDTGNIRPALVDAYRHADRLSPFGFSGWIGREPHGAARGDTGMVRDELFADQVEELFSSLADDRTRPWLAVASFVNPHDIAFSGAGWKFLGFPELDESVPDPGVAPSQDDSFANRPRCQEEYRSTWAAMLYEQAADADYRRLYLWLHEIVDRAIARVVDGLHASGMAEDTIVVLTSDHGDLLGAHGGLQQKWYNAYDESLRVPLTVCGPDIPSSGAGIDTPTSHVDLLPTLLGLVGADVERVTSTVADRHTETQAPVGRDLSAAIRSGDAGAVDGAPVYFMTEDQISRGLTTVNPLTQEHYEPVEEPANVESVITSLPDGDGGTTLWKLNHYYERLDDWEASVGRSRHANGDEATISEWELHDLTADPEERHNLAGDDGVPLDELRTVLVDARNRSRRVPTVTNA